jgi:hypothetical protein
MITHMYLSGSGSAAIDVPADDVLEEVVITIQHAGEVDQVGQAQLSFGSTAVFTTNDARQTIATFVSSFYVLTSGYSLGAQSLVCHPNVKINAGERIYLHGDWSAGTGIVRATLYTSKGDGPTTPVRRR